MKILIVEDDIISRIALTRMLEGQAKLDAASDGQQAVELFNQALAGDEPYDLIFLDIMLPEMDGQTALLQMREIERARGVMPGQEAHVIMTTCLDDPKNVSQAFFRGEASGYLVKPLDRQKLLEKTRELGFELF